MWIFAISAHRSRCNEAAASCDRAPSSSDWKLIKRICSMAGKHISTSTCIDEIETFLRNFKADPSKQLSSSIAKGQKSLLVHISNHFREFVVERNMNFNDIWFAAINQVLFSAIRSILISPAEAHLVMLTICINFQRQRMPEPEHAVDIDSKWKLIAHQFDFENLRFTERRASDGSSWMFHHSSRRFSESNWIFLSLTDFI